MPKITLTPKDYDGRTATAVESIEWEGLAEGDELVQGVDYKIVASDFETADAGKDKPATVEIQLLTESGTEAMRLYRLEDAQYPDGTTIQETYKVKGTVNPAELTPEMFEEIGPQECTGQKLEPPVKTTGTGALVTEDDYTLTYGDNINETGTVTISGKNNFTGTVELTFEIIGEPVPVPEVTLTAQTELSGKPQSAFTYGDTLVVTGKLLSDGKGVAGESVMLYAVGSGQTLLGSGKTGTDGSFSIAYETSRKGVEPGACELEVRAGEKSVTLEASLGKRSVTPKVTGSARKTYDAKTTVPAGHTLGIGLTGVLSGDASSVKASASFSFASAAAGEKTVVATGIKLASSGSARFYKLSATTVRGEVGSIDKATLSEAAREATLKAGVSGDRCTLELSGTRGRRRRAMRA